MFRSFWNPAIVLIRTSSPSRSHHTTDVCGDPSGITVVSAATGGQTTRSRKASGIVAADARRPRTGAAATSAGDAATGELRSPHVKQRDSDAVRDERAVRDELEQDAGSRRVRREQAREIAR